MDQHTELIELKPNSKILKFNSQIRESHWILIKLSNRNEFSTYTCSIGTLSTISSYYYILLLYCTFYILPTISYYSIIPIISYLLYLTYYIVPIISYLLYITYHILHTISYYYITYYIIIFSFHLNYLNVQSKNHAISLFKSI